MPVKFECPKCSKRFIDWGAEKLGFKCPDCADEDLVQMGSTAGKSAKRPVKKTEVKTAKAPSLKRRAAVPDELAEVPDIDDDDIGDEELVDDDEVVSDVDDDDDTEDLDTALAADGGKEPDDEEADAPAALAFGDGSSASEKDADDASNSDDEFS